MKILIICYCYPPDLGPRAFRWAAVAEDWAERGHEVHVVSVKKADWPDEDILNGVNVHRVAGLEPEGLRASVAAQSSPVGPDTTARQLGPRLLLKRIHNLTWKKLYWPDSNCLWFFPARRKALALAEEIRFDSMVSVSTPYTGHLVAKSIKKRLAELRWLVDIGDPFCFSETPWNNERLYQRFNKASEHRIFELADCISVTVSSCKAIYIDLFPCAGEKIFVNPPLFSGAIDDSPAQRCDNGATRLVFTGSLYSEIRNPKYLLSLLAAVLPEHPGLQVHFYGRLNDCGRFFEPYRNQFGQSIHLHGLVSREDALQAIREADMLVNIGNDTFYQLPSKLVDYAATGRPVINIIKNAEDSSIGFFDTYPHALSVLDNGMPPSVETIQDIKHFIDTSAGKRFSVDSFMQPYLIDNISEAYLQHLIER